MKTKLTTLLFTLLSVATFYGQKPIVQEDDELKVTFTKDSITAFDKKEQKEYTFYKNIDTQDVLKKAVENNYLFTAKFDIKGSKKEPKLNKREGDLFNEAMLNILFAEEVSSYIGESKDLSLKKSYAVLSTADKTLFLGRSFVVGRKDDTDRLKHLFTVGLKTKLKDDFSTIINKKENLENEIDVNFKWTLIGRGIINFGCYEDEIRRLKKDVVIHNQIKKVEKDIDNETYINELKEYEDIYGVNSSKYLNKKENYFKNKYKEYYLELAEKEIERIRKEKLYSHVWDHYGTLEVFVPVTRKFYSVLPTATTLKPSEEPFYPWKINGGYTNFWKFSNGNTFYISGFGSIFNNNNIQIEDLKTFSLQTPNANNSNLIDSNNVYFGDYNRFTTGSIKGETVSYFFKNGTFGLSGALEQYIGADYHPLNWKLGIPVSLKDKEGKPTVNFELQWKEVNGEHLVGIGIGFAFGKFIK